jgi:hypothetical protein
MFESCMQLWRLYHDFRSGAIDPGDFRHHQHLAVALCYASVMPPEVAVECFREDLLRMVRPWGHERKYHETITRFWLAVAAHYLRAQSEKQWRRPRTHSSSGSATRALSSDTIRRRSCSRTRRVRAGSPPIVSLYRRRRHALRTIAAVAMPRRILLTNSNANCFHTRLSGNGWTA